MSLWKKDLEVVSDVVYTLDNRKGGVTVLLNVSGERAGVLCQL